MSYFIGLMGMWLFCDGWMSVAIYIGKEGQGWLKDHSIRIIRCFCGIVLMVMGFYGI